jgi:hypothetical protein
MAINMVWWGLLSVESAAVSLRLQAMPEVPPLVVLGMVEVQVLEEDQD